MPLSEKEQQEVLRRVQADDVVQARQAVRDAFWRLMHWPFSRSRVNAFFDAFERVQDLNANRAMSNIGPVAALLSGRLDNHEQRLASLERWRDEAGRQ